MKRFWHWLGENATQIQAVGAIAALVAAMGGVYLVMHQIDASDQQQRRQSAREIYREFVKLSVERPNLAAPDYCAIRTSPAQTDDAEYENFLQFQLYATEQILDELPDWEETMNQHLEPHKDLLCSEADWAEGTPPVRALIGRFRKQQCAAYVSPCPDAAGKDQ